MNNNFNNDQTNVTNNQGPSMNGFPDNNMNNDFNNQQFFNNNGGNGTPMGQGPQNNGNTMGNQSNFNQPNMQGNNQPNGNGMNQNGNKKMGNFDKNKIIKIALIAVVIVVVLFLLKGCFSVLGGHKNTTGSSEYKAKDVDLNCSYEKTDSERKVTAHIDALFDYKNGSSTYALKQYSKMVYDYTNGLTNEAYKKFIESVDATACWEADKCEKNHIDLGLSKLGYDTIIERNGNQITMTFYNLVGIGQKATKDDKDAFIKEYESNGFKCE